MISCVAKREMLPGLEEELDHTGSTKLYGRTDHPSKSRASAVVRHIASGETAQQSEHRSGSSSCPDSLPELTREAIRKSCNLFFGMQASEGYWWAELESNVSITAEYIMLLYLLGIHDAEKQKRMVKYLLNHQTDDGSWALYYGDQGNLSSTVEAYFALKLAGEDPDSDAMQRARAYILKNGGIEATRVFTKIWLALFAQYDWNLIPSMPVELVLLPSDCYFNIYEFSSWARGTIVPLAIIMAIRPRMKLQAGESIPELYTSPGTSSGHTKRFASYTHKLFFLIDRIVKSLEERHPLPKLRNRAVQEAETWILDHQEESGDWGGIQPPMVYSILALHYLAYPVDHEAIAKGLKALEDFCIDDDEGLRLQSCISPVWDTALTSLALLDAGVPPENHSLQRASDWLVKKQVTTGGDWQVKNCCPPGGWSFEFVNNQYPDVDDSAVVLIALQRILSSQCSQSECVKKRGIEWCLSMQSSNGGWAAFDKDNLMLILNRIPFADNEAMVDYPTEDVTGRVLEAMGYFGYKKSHPSAVKAIRYLKEVQEPDGCWWGRWGVNYIYGTWSVLRGLISIGENPDAPYIQNAARWLKSHQNEDGGWGESCESYKNPDLRGQGPSTASQTAWALMGLILTGHEQSHEVRRGVKYLVETQQPDGSWEERHFTGTGFPNHFYIRYHIYRNCFPLMALGQYMHKIGGGTSIAA
jgi:squalene-hopene/tetraprenyl-beta-curcumene cyclase